MKNNKKRLAMLLAVVVLLGISCVISNCRNHSLPELGNSTIRHKLVPQLKNTLPISTPKQFCPTNSSTVSAQTLILTDSFEDGLKDDWYREMAQESYSGVVSNLYAKDGKSSFRVELRKSDPMVSEGKRAQILMIATDQSMLEYTYSFSMLLPKGGNEDYALDPYGSEIIAEWINSPDPGEEGTTPPLALRTINGMYVLERCWDDEAVTSNDQMTRQGKRAVYKLGSYENDKGKFVAWTFKVKWGWLAAQKPVMEIYKDSVKILDLDGLPNTTNDQKGVRLKLGISKWDWAQDQAHDWSLLEKRVIYYDDVSIKSS